MTVLEYLEESWWLGDIFDSVEDLFEDCMLALRVTLAPFEPNPNAVLLQLLEHPLEVAKLIR
jgi:hypothetical protein